MNMREIKFRGKRVDNGEWIYGFYYHSTINGRDYIADLVETRSEEVIPESVGQFTGLHDKNGKEAYEGDICSFNYDNHKRIEDVHFGDGSFTLGWCMTLREAFLDCHEETRKSIEVIGNIYENEELKIYFNSSVVEV